MLLLEHVNLVVACRATALAFYQALGCTEVLGREQRSLHVDCGALTQFHFSTPPPGTAPLAPFPGEVHVAYATPHARDAAVAAAAAAGAGSVEAASGRLRDPDGNTLVLCVAPAAAAASALAGTAGVRPGSAPAVAGAPRPLGLLRLVVDVPAGAAAAEGLRRFYEQVFGWEAAVCGGEGGAGGVLRVAGGPGGGAQELLFRAAAGGGDGGGTSAHFCVYTGGFEAALKAAEARGLLFSNARFGATAGAESVEAALAEKQFRLLRACDPASGEVVLELEHEVRSVEHGSLAFADKAAMGAVA